MGMLATVQCPLSKEMAGFFLRLGKSLYFFAQFLK